MQHIARWETRGGRYFVDLYKASGSGWYYRGDNCLGYLGNDLSEAQAIEYIDSRCKPGIDSYFLPDNAKTAMTMTRASEARS